jgi:cobalt-zinc-cadmium efflux system outer membrane protein
MASFTLAAVPTALACRPLRRPIRVAAGLIVQLVILSALSARTVHGEETPPASTASLVPADYADEDKLAALLWERSPEVIEARQQIGVAGSEVTRSHLYHNPQLDLGWNTIPIGPSNPPDLHDPIGNIPNYVVGLSQLFELAKRGPKQAAAAAELEASRGEATAVFADRFFDLLHAIGHIASSQVRATVVGEQVEEGKRLLELEEARAEKGEIARMLVDRSETEQARLLAARDAARTELEAARAECAALIAVVCPPFASGDAARAYLRERATAPLPTEWSPEIEARRPDIAALAAALRAADERVTLAKRQAIPDVTVRFGYEYDTFMVSGDQRQSLALGMQMPLPVLDRGQADLQAASAALMRAQRARAALVSTGQITLDAAERQRTLIASRISKFRGALEKADSLRHSMEGAAQQGGMSQVDVLLARRRYQELLLEGAELDGDAYGAALKVRQVAALFPRPVVGVEEAQR